MVTERILRDDRLAGEPIMAEADDGIVRLIVVVDTDERTELAEEIASGMPVVRYVQDLIEVG